VVFDDLSISEQQISAKLGEETLTPLLSLALSGTLDLPLPGSGVVTAQVLADLEAVELSLRQRAVELANAANKLAALVAGLRSLDA